MSERLRRLEQELEDAQNEAAKMHSKFFGPYAFDIGLTLGVPSYSEYSEQDRIRQAREIRRIRDQIDRERARLGMDRYMPKGDACNCWLLALVIIVVTVVIFFLSRAWM